MKKVIILIAIIILTQPLFASQVVLDNVIPSWDDVGETKLFQNARTTFNFRFINDEPTDAGGFTNGFVVWTTNGSPFDPVVLDTLPVDFGGGNGWNDVFDLMVNLPHFSADGISVDSAGIMAASAYSGLAMPAGFNEIAVSITTGNLAKGTTICIDSAFLPANYLWKWSNSTPSWGGPYCLMVSEFALPLIFTNCVDTLKIPYSNNISYQFNVMRDPLDQDTSPIDVAKYFGVGNLDNSTGLWTYEATPADIGQSSQLLIWAFTQNTFKAECQTVLQIGHPMPGDIDLNGQADIDDIVFMIDYMFGFGGDFPVPEFLIMLDCDGSGLGDIDDLILLINYLFGTGDSPCVDPW